MIVNDIACVIVRVLMFRFRTNLFARHLVCRALIWDLPLLLDRHVKARPAAVRVLPGFCHVMLGFAICFPSIGGMLREHTLEVLAADGLRAPRFRLYQNGFAWIYRRAFSFPLSGFVAGFACFEVNFRSTKQVL